MKTLAPNADIYHFYIANSHTSISFNLSGGLRSLLFLRSTLLLFLLLQLHHEFSVVVNELPELAPEEGTDEYGDGAHRDQEKKGGLRVLEDEHGKEGLDDAVEVSSKGKVEVVEFDFIIAVDLWVLFEGLVDVELQAEGYEEAWQDDIAQPDHAFGDFPFGVQKGEHQLNWKVEVLGNGHHHICSVDPEDVVEEQGPKKKKPSSRSAQI